MRKKKLSAFSKIRVLSTSSASFLLIIGMSLAGATTAAYWIRLSFWFELFNSFSVQILFITMSILIMAIAIMLHKGMSEGWANCFKIYRRLYIMMILLTGLLFHNFYMSSIQPVYAEIDPRYTGSSIKVMTFNKHYDNKVDSQITNYINNKQPDVLAIQEIFIEEAKILAEKIGYTHWHIASCGCSAYGSDLALFSRFPLNNVDMLFEDRLGGFLRGEVELGHEKIIVVYVAHVVPPYSAREYQIRPLMLDKLAAEVNTETNPLIIAGDFSTTVNSIDMRDLLKQISEKNHVVGDLPWPKCSWFGFSEFLCVRIDHVIIPTDSTVIESNIGPHLGSDHRPVEVDISI